MHSRNTWTLTILAAGLSLFVACAATDSGITTKVKSSFVADDTVKASQIEVTTYNGVVTLTGNVDDVATKERAIQLAKSTQGVVKVVDMLSAREGSATGNAPDTDRTLGEVVTDGGITMSVKSRLLEDPLVKGLRIDVDTRDGIVYLTGSVASDVERQKAVQLTKETKGVREVQSNLTLDRS
jgi:osmotically-inducible protein OsmY